jgi:benzoate-CoA ligase
MALIRENLAARLLLTAEERGWSTRVALRHDGRTWTYADLHIHVQQLATVLTELGIAPGERVAVLMGDSLEAAGAILGIIYAGAIAVPVSELARPETIRNGMLDAGAVAAIADRELEPALDEIRLGTPELRHILCVGGVSRPGVHDCDALLAADPEHAAPVAVASDDPALLLYSKIGVQRELRGIPLQHGTPFPAFESFTSAVAELTDSDRVFSLGRLYTTYGLRTGLLFPLIAGCESLLLSGKPHSEAILEVIRGFDPTVFCATPSIYGQLTRDLADGDWDRPLAGCRVALSSAEEMPAKLVPRIREVLGVEISVGYGLTEGFEFVFAGRLDELPSGSAGRLVPGFEVRILGDDGEPCGPDEIGTLAIRGATVFDRYWRDDVTVTTDNGWYVTEDRFMKDAQGDYFFCGRADELFKVGGKWVSPVEIERALMAHEAVWDCAVIGADDEDGLIKPFAFLVANVGHEAGDALERDLREYVKQVLAPYKYPRWFEFRDRLPKGPTGKVLRYKLKPRLVARMAETIDEEL